MRPLDRRLARIIPESHNAFKNNRKHRFFNEYEISYFGNPVIRFRRKDLFCNRQAGWQDAPGKGEESVRPWTYPGEIFWDKPEEEILLSLGSGVSGLSSAEAARRLASHGKNSFGKRRFPVLPGILFRQFSSPIVLILVGSSIVAFSVGERTDGLIILGIVILGAFLGFLQEYRADSAVKSLMKLVELRSDVMRDGSRTTIPMEDVVPGDVVILSAGDGIPGDCRLIGVQDLFVDEASLTGETFPAEKNLDVLPAETSLPHRANCVFSGTHVVSGNGLAVAVRTGRETVYGSMADRIRIKPDQTEFEQGVRRFGTMLAKIIFPVVAVIFALNVSLRKPLMDSFLFALALAVGLTPEMLPAVVSVNLSVGARRMASRNVIVKRLSAMENFGSMDILCMDKTGTITEGTVSLEGALDIDGGPSGEVLLLGAVNAVLQTHFRNPIDVALRQAAPEAASQARGLDEIPYDFVRKRLSILADIHGEVLLISKGAFLQILDVCGTARIPGGGTVPMGTVRPKLEKLYGDFSARGLRTLGLAFRRLPGRSRITREDESDLSFLGFLLFEDPPKKGIADTLAELGKMGITFKVITGDNILVARRTAVQIGLPDACALTGRELRELSDEALPRKALETGIFAEVEPNQKERLIRALRKTGHVVGYLGDGINDAPALHAADVGLSVQSGVDAAKEAADIVLLESDLHVLIQGIREGRTTFANTLKYIFMATSANFGNMFSMAGASLILPFLPLLPKQILLTNLLTDFPAMSVSSDSVDSDLIKSPQRWNASLIRSFMISFGLLSSVFDFLTFGALLFLFRAPERLFQSGWFVESVVSATLILLVIRTRKRGFRPVPSGLLSIAVTSAVTAAAVLPFTSLGRLFGFEPVPPSFFGFLAGIVAFYLAAAERLKVLFFRIAQKDGPRREQKFIPF